MSPAARKESRDVEPSRLDDNTHAELRLIFEDSSRAILFAKGMQWKTVGATLAIFAGLIAIFFAIVSQAKFVSSKSDFLNGLELIIFLTAAVAVLALIIFQVWQHTEARKIRELGTYFSSAFIDIRDSKSDLTADISRYVLLLFMIGIIVICAVLTDISLTKLTMRYI